MCLDCRSWMLTVLKSFSHFTSQPDGAAERAAFARTTLSIYTTGGEREKEKGKAIACVECSLQSSSNCSIMLRRTVNKCNNCHLGPPSANLRQLDCRISTSRQAQLTLWRISFHSLPWFLYCYIQNTYISHSLFPVPKRSTTHLPELCHCQIKANAECKGADEDGRHVDGVALEEVDLGEV